MMSLFTLTMFAGAVLFGTAWLAVWQRDFFKSTIDRLSSETYTKDFITGQETKINYTKAKIIDMYGFQLGLLKTATT